MWAIIGPFIAKYWAKLLAAAALIGSGLYAGLKIMSALNKGKIERAERKADKYDEDRKRAEQIAENERKKNKSAKEREKLQEKEKRDEKAIADKPDDSLLDDLDGMLDDF